MKKIWIICLLVLNICCIICGGKMIVQAADALNFFCDWVPQQKTMWCWAASAENSIIYEMDDRTRDQASAVNILKGTSIIPYPNVGGTLKDIKDAAEYISEGTESYKVSSLSLTLGVKSFAFLKSQVQNRDVTLLNTGYYDLQGNRSGGHVYACIGYYITDNGEEELTLYDPWNGGMRYVVPYTTFVEGDDSERYDGTVWNAE